MKNFIRSGVKISFGTATLGLSALLLFSLLSPFLPLADSVAHFRLYIMGALLVAGVLCGFMGLKKSGLLASMVVAAGVISIAPVIYNWDEFRAGDQAADLKIMQFNLLYNNRMPDKVISFIRTHNPDIITLQEVSRSHDKILENLKNDYPYSALCFDSGIRNSMVLSKLPPVPENGQACEKYPDMAGGYQVPGVPRLTILVKGQQINVISLHLLWPYPYGQQRHIEQIGKTLSGLSGPVIIAGDFNAAPWSHAVRKIETASQTKIIGGIRHSWSYRTTLPPVLPIDHILIPSNMTAHSVEVGDHVGSDHRPIIAKLRFKP